MFQKIRDIFKRKEEKEKQENIFNFKRKQNKKFIIKFDFLKKINKYHIISFIVIIILFIAFFINSFLRINIIQITKNDDITNLSVAYKSVDKFRGKFLFLIRNSDIEKAFKNNQKNIKDVSIFKLPNNTLKIKLESYGTIFKTIFNEKNYTITTNGVFIPNINKNSKLKMLEIKTSKQVNFPDYKIILSEKYLEKISYLQNKLVENIVNLKINQLIYYVTERELHIINENGIRFMFDLEGDLDKQIKQLAIFNKDYFNLSQTGMIYIDLRINNKVFYCGTGTGGENTQICINNLTNIYKK